MTCPSCGIGGIGKASLDWADLPWMLFLHAPFRCHRGSEISRLVLESLTCDFPCVLLARDSSVVAFYFFKLIVSCFSIIGLATSSQRASARNQLPSTRRATIDTFVRYHSSFLPGK